MNICFDIPHRGTKCLGDVMAQVHGSEYGLNHGGMAMIALFIGVLLVFVFRDPA